MRPDQLWSVGDPWSPFEDDPAFPDRDEAEGRARKDSETAGFVLAVFSPDGHGNELVALAFDGRLFRGE